jgi:hypothetical protein
MPPLIPLRPAALAVVLLLATCVHPAGAQDSITVQGEVLDMACYLAKDKKGPEHKSCALLCAKAGKPIGVLTDAGEVYLLIDDHDNEEPYERLKKLAGSRAEITGQKFDKGGVAGIMVTESKPL